MDDILRVFRVIASEYNNMTDEEVTAFIELFAPMVSKHTFGAKYNLAVAYLIAHIITLQNQYTSSAGASNNPAVAGVKREKEGDLEREYAIPDSSDYMSLLYQTYYGRFYLQLMKMCAIGIKTRFG